MKAMALLPAIAAAILSLDISAASSQQACMKEFQACMDGCAGRPSKAVQDTCFQNCEGKNNFCAERVYGKRPVNGAPAASAEAKDAPKEELAKNPKQAADARDQADPKQILQNIQQQKQAPARR